jgi:hypothetical protein
MSKLSILKEFFQFIKANKKWWLIPIVVILLAIGTLLFATEGSMLAPLIYTLF